MNQTRRILVNSIAQYVRIVCVIIISLYSTRIILQELGSEDFGLYSLIGSALAFLSFLNTSIIRSTQRYLSYYMGRGDISYQRIVLFNSIILNLIISLVTCILIVSLMSLIIDDFLCIDEDKIDMAKQLYLLMCISLFFTINVSPFNAVFVAHENIVFSSFTYILISVLRLFAALLLCFFQSQKLLWYGIFMASISVIEYAIYYFVARMKYSECRKFADISLIDKELLKSILFFSFWNLYGTLCVMGRNQGYAFVINKFMNITANAAYGIANQVSGQIINFVYSLSNAISPIIMRSEGANNRKKMTILSIESSKISVLTFSLIAIPIITDIEYILNLWLGRVPEYTVPFVVSIVIACICDSFSAGFRLGIQAIGNIKIYSLWVYSIKIASIPLSVFMLINGYDCIYLFIPYILTELIGSIITIFFFCRYSGVSFVRVIYENIFMLVIPFFTALFFGYIIRNTMEEGLYRFFIIFLTCSLTTMISIYFFSLTPKEKEIVKNIISKYNFIR